MRFLILILALSACVPRIKQVKPTPAETKQAVAQHENDAIQALLTGDIFPEMRVSACKEATESAKIAAKLRRELERE